MEIRQGDIYWGSPAIEGGSEAGIQHPLLVVSEDIFNRSRIHTVVVCAITTNRKRVSLPGNLLLEPGEANLPRQSVVEVSKLSTIEKTQLGEYIGSLSRARVDQVLAGIRFLQHLGAPGVPEMVESPPDHKLEQLVLEYIDSGDVLGLAIAVFDRRELSYSAGFGVAGVENPEAVKPRTLFGIGSISKTLLAALIMRLVEAGRLDLDTPVVKYLDGFEFSRRDYGERVTLRHLLSHTSGLPGAGKDWGPPGVEALKRYVYDQLSTHSFLAEPGRIHLYSSTAICLAGYVAEVVGGKPYRELLQELVLNPLGMQHTTFEHAVAMTCPLALPHEEDEYGGLHVVHRLADNASGEPSGFAFSTVLDLANFGRMLLNLGSFNGQAFLSEKSISSMETPAAERPIYGARHPLAYLYMGYGLGLQTGSFRGERVVRHGGVIQSYNCFFELLPDLGRGMIVLTNHSREPRLSELIVRLYNHLMGSPDQGRFFIEIPPGKQKALDTSSWGQFVGAYLNVEYGRLIRIHLRDEALWYEEGARQSQLASVADGQYYIEGEDGVRVPVIFSPGREAACEVVYVAGYPFLRFELDEEFQPDQEDLRRFEGLYRDPTNLDPASPLKISRDRNQLMLMGDGADEALRPLAPGAFLSSLGLVEFISGDGGTLPHRIVDTLVLGKATRYYRQTE